MTDTTTTTTGPELWYQFSQRLERELAHAQAEADRVTAAEAAASAAVDAARGDFQIGRIRKGELLVKQRQLSLLQGLAEDARQRVKAIARDHDRQRAERKRAEWEIERRLQVERAAEDARRGARARELVGEINERLEELRGLRKPPEQVAAAFGAAWWRLVQSIGQ